MAIWLALSLLKPVKLILTLDKLVCNLVNKLLWADPSHTGFACAKGKKLGKEDEGNHAKTWWTRLRGKGLARA